MKRAALALLALASPASARWISAWTAAPFPATPVLAAQDVRDYAGAAVSQSAVIGAGGPRLRVRMTNALGAAPLAFASATVAADGGPPLALAFEGQAGTTIPAGASLASDPVAIPVHRFERLTVTVRYDGSAIPAAHLLSVRLTAPDGRVREGRGPALAAAIEVEAIPDAKVLVAFGDSITEGAGASGGAFGGWPERFARRLAALPAYRDWTVVNAGISGNRLLRDGAGPNALARFDRDVLSVPGVAAVILLEGVNDIGWGTAKPATDGPVTAADVIAADRQLVARAHAEGVRVIGATLTPFAGSVYHTATGETVRDAVNRWIRTSGTFDGVVDFAAAVADPADPARLEPADDPGDHLHPNDRGYSAMAAAIDPAVLR